MSATKMGTSTQIVDPATSYYGIVQKPGGGGMGIVYKAEDGNESSRVQLQLEAASTKISNPAQ
jgi:hypothetical protein